jgi:hypothetical protein
MRCDDVFELQPPMGASIVHPRMICKYGATVEWYWQGKTEQHGGKSVPVPLFPPQIPYGLAQSQTQAFTVKGYQLTWAVAQPTNILLLLPVFRSENVTVDIQSTSSNLDA